LIREWLTGYTDVAFRSEELSCVIAGCGLSAMINHSILQQTGHRPQGIVVLDIGTPDPWDRLSHPLMVTTLDLS
jgi:hypothetical protein